MLAVLASCLYLAGVQSPIGPVEFGVADLTAALKARGLSQIKIEFDPDVSDVIPDESYRLCFAKDRIVIDDSDTNGLMYGLLEAAERVRNSGKDAWKQPVVTGKPYLQDRGWNMFLPLPWDYDKNFVDNDPAALTDPKRWFFMNDDYWHTLFDQMARSRLNWLDIHGPYDLDTTRFPNLYAYFIQSDKFPKVGVAPEIKATLLKQLNQVIDMAHARGIRVSLMSYEARFDVPHNPNPGYKGTEAEIYDYTKEVVEKMIRQAPKLDKIGYRIGESGRGAEFFKCYTEAVAASGRDIPVYTRSWVTTKARVVPLAKASNDFTVEIKYNGEQWGAPYIMQGGRTAGWYSYFWEDYLSYSGADGAKKMWEGVESQLPSGDARGKGEGAQASSKSPSAAKRPVSAPLNTAITPTPSLPRQGGAGSDRWPSQPYKIVWQVRANGTHRIFPFYQPHWTRSSILSMKVGTTSGYTIESMASYFPQEPKYYMADPSKAGYKWIHQRDEMYVACWGRLGYDPTVPDWKFDRMVMRKFGPEVGKPLAEAWKAASKVVPIAFMGYALGPDHRNHAPELEWGGDSEAYLQGEPFDSHVFMNPREALAIAVTNGNDGRKTPDIVGRELVVNGEVVLRSLDASGLLDDTRSRNQPLSELAATLVQLGYLSKYYGFRLAGAYYFARAQPGMESGLGGEQVQKLSAKVAASLADGARTEWDRLANGSGSLFYRPFTDRLRLHTHRFHWQNELAKVAADAANQIGGSTPENPEEAISSIQGLYSSKAPQASVRAAIAAGRVRVEVLGSDILKAWLLEKPLPSSAFFHKTPMTRVGDKFVADFRREAWGHCIAAEIEVAGRMGEEVHRIPDFEKGTPYLTVPSLETPTPFIYSAEEAMRYLDPKALDPAKYGWMIVGTRGWMFHTRFDNPTKRKVLAAVEKGMNLLVMQQDYTSGRYPLDWLPIKPKLVNRQETVFDPAGALGMERVETKEILWQPFEKSPGWEVFGNGGVAKLQYGKGEIWMVQGRFLQRMHIPGVARNLKKLLEATVGKGLPSFEGGVGVDVRHLLADAGIANPKSVPTSRDLGSATKIRNPKSRVKSSPTPTPPSREGPLRPAILIDTGTEGANYVTSVIPDFMNAHDLPFLTLGEVIAKEQGMDSMTAVPGPSFDDDLLGGKGKEIANRYLKSAVQKASKLPTPANLEDFEKERKRRKAELLRSLGLDPMPPKTPLNARVTGEIPRKGYKIQKIVFESRPRFYVTAHLYLPDPMPVGKLPVVVHVNGHWAHKKDEDRIQLRAAFCAVRGYAALAIDSPGVSFEGNNLIERRAEGDHNDWLLAMATNTTGIYVWDVIRGLDYLETRPEMDMTKVGLTGASGGGLATLYAFAAEDRFKAAVPVVYMSSMELAPDNGCLCNHVPATCQVGDRSDVISIQAPKPVYLFGAEVDPEFPPDAMRLTGYKMVETWSLFGKGDDAKTRIYPGGHDYSQPMREAMIGFFDKYLRGVGNGSPVAQPPLEAINPEDRVLLALDPPEKNERTMRELTLEYLANAPKEVTVEQALAVNGGRPKVTPANFKISPFGPKMTVTFEAEPGFVTPAVFLPGADLTKPVTLIVSDDGKAAEILKDGSSRKDSRVYIDILGTGELAGFELRYPTYLGKSTAFLGGVQLVAAAKLLRQNGHGGQIQIEARGPLAGLAAMWAGLIESDAFAKISATGALKTWEDAFKPGISPYLMQPRAHLVGKLEFLQKQVKNSEWK